MIKNIITGICLFGLGIGMGVAGLFLIGRFLPFDHPLVKMLGMEKPQIVGFLPYWLLDKADKDYAPFLTTLSYFGLAVDTDGKPIYLVNQNEEDPGWTALKGDRLAVMRDEAKKKGLNTSLLVYNADEKRIAELLMHPEGAAHALVAEVGPIMQSRGFTDLNLDFESFLPASESARQAYTQFASTVAHDVRAAKLGTVTIEIPPIILTKKYMIDPVAIGQIADYVVMMTYDYHYLGSFLAGPVAPIGGGGDIFEFDVETSVKEAVKVIPRQKLLLGIPLYGYQWETIGDMPGAATIPGGASTASSRRVSEFLTECATCSAQFDTRFGEPSIVYRNGDYFVHVHYENAEAIAAKVALAQKYRLGGVALWALGYEDDTMLMPLREYKTSFTLMH